MSTTLRSFPAIRAEGGLFAPDLFDQLLAGEAPGQKPSDFGLDNRRKLTDAMAATFGDAQALWSVFRRRLDHLNETDPATTLTRDIWMVPFLSLLGYDLRYNRPAPVIGGLPFSISHRAGEAEDAPPIHIVGARHDLDRLPPSGRATRLAPHSLVQEFLNRTDALWGIVTNGLVVRLLRNSTYIRRQCYVEFDLAAIFDQHLFPDFVVLYHLLHRSRLPHSSADAHRCPLERHYQTSVEQGGRVRDRLRDGVKACLTRLADGFLAHPQNAELRRRLTSTAADRLTPEAFYRQLLWLVYRFLFLFVADERGFLSQHPLYLEDYSASRLRSLVALPAAYTDHDDLWLSLQALWKLLSDDTPVQQLAGRPLAALLDLPVLNGALFAPSAFDTCRLTNRDLLAALRFLDSYQESDKGATRRVNYAALDVEELGSVYESLLDYHPNIPTTAGRLHFELKEGFERKGTGSYYTPPELVAELISSALAPVVAERLAQLPPTATPEEKAQALLALRVIDPACGSGHFLLAAARWLGRKLAGIRVGTDEPPPEAVRAAIREVVTHSIYGVDKNPLAVELCRVALWIESYCAGKPLTFLEHRIRCGNSLVGVFDLAALKQGVPDEAFSPGPDDTKSIAAELKKRNRQQRGGQRSFFAAFDAPAEVAQFSKAAQALNAVPDDTPQDIRRKMERYEALSAQTARDRLACDLWTAAFFQRFTPGAPPITTETVWDALEATSAHGQVVGQARALAEQLGFFHWPLAFPEVFAQGGFDVVLSNPPWERIKLQEKEFFENEDATIANAKHKAERARLMAELEQRNLSLWRNYRQTLHIAEATSKFLRRGERFPLTGHGDINTYSVFAELAWQLLAPHGQAGIVVPTGIATDDTNKHFFGELAQTQHLVSLFDFENRDGIFPGVHRSYKFALLTLRRAATEQTTLAFFCTRADQLHE
ncbi:MAG: N-6 DNA methylase, partial [Chloracidobacterium sp.]